MKLNNHLNHDIIIETKRTDQNGLKNLLVRLNAAYAKKEASTPYEGYRVLFEEKPNFQARLIPMGGLRKTAKLSGAPDNDRQYQAKDCPFCTSDVKVHRVFQDRNRAIVSRSGQILLIPDKHYSHWFEMPVEDQLKLLEHALDQRKLYSSSKHPPMELHCGSAGNQTVFHTHLRTGIFKA
jgi:hypothetical protein